MASMCVDVVEVPLELSPGHALHYACFEGICPARADLLLQRYLPRKAKTPASASEVGEKRKADESVADDKGVPQVTRARD